MQGPYEHYGGGIDAQRRSYAAFMERVRRISILMVALSVFALSACSGAGELPNPIPSPGHRGRDVHHSTGPCVSVRLRHGQPGNRVAEYDQQWRREPGDTRCSALGHRAAGLCTSVTPVSLARVDTDPRRTTEVVSVVSDGRNLTSGTREQNDFLTPVLTSPDQTAVTDEPTIRKIAGLIAAQKHRVLLVRPDAPDASANVSKKPFSSPGTYVIYNASSQLTADVGRQCSGEEQTWTFLAEADPSTGQVNCTVEPSKSNALARQIFQNNC